VQNKFEQRGPAFNDGTEPGMLTAAILTGAD
jgi:hypothetical protein